MVSAYTTATYVQEELRAESPFSSTTYPSLTTAERWIEEASTEIDHLAGFVASETAYTSYVDYTDQEILCLENSPIISISSISENTNSLGSGDGEAWVTKTEGSHYVVYNESGQVLINFLTWNPKAGYRRLRIIYTAGYSTTPVLHRMLATKMVAERTLSSLIAKNVNEANDGGSISVGSISIVEPSSYGVNSYNRLKTDISDMKDMLLNGTSAYRY